MRLAGISRLKRDFKGDEDEPVENQDVWVSIDKTVRDVDEEKVKDCADDIDTLLVFVGLYSAVLTAFLIESYKTLTADPTQALLQQLVSQSANYQFTGGFLNTTFDDSQLPVFEVTTSAIRVNVCWFASLVISLSTASYGILVKQWLREYLAIDRIAAHERLRVRHFRKQGLETWRLFDIAAILPMFLQLSLILFLVGLCFFTAAVHESIARTSLVLVCAWAFFLALTILAPLISARCPYKTTFLKFAFRLLRPHIHYLVHKTAVCSLRFATRLHSSLGPVISTIYQRFLEPLGRFTLPSVSSCGRRLRAMCYSNRNPAPDNDSIGSAVAPEHGEALMYDNYKDAIHDDRFHLEYMVLFTETALEDPTNSRKEESMVRSDERGDPVVFRDIDSIFLDDGILVMMRKALQKRPPPGEEVLKSVIGILQYRSDIVFCSLDSRSAKAIGWPWALSASARTTLIDILTDSLLFQASKGFSLPHWRNAQFFYQDLLWMDQALSLVLALSAGNNSLPQSMSSVLEGWLRDQASLNMICIILANQLKVDFMGLPKRISIRWQVHVFTLLFAVLELLPTGDAAQAFKRIVRSSYGGLDGLISTNHPHHTIELLPETEVQDGARPTQDNEVTESPFVVLTLLDVAAGICSSLTVVQADEPEGEGPISAFPENVQDLIHFIFQAISFVEKEIPAAKPRKGLPISGVGLKGLIWTLFTAPTPRHTHAFLDFWSIRSGFLNTQLRPGQFLYDTLNPPEFDFHWFPDEAAIQFLSACATYFDSKLSSDTPLELVSTIRLCHLVFAVSTSSNGDVLRGWRIMFASALNCIDRISSDSAAQKDQENRPPQCTGGEHSDACLAAFALLDEMDPSQNDPQSSYLFRGRFGLRERLPGRKTTGYAAWAASFNAEKAQFPDTMVNALFRFVCEAHTKNGEGRVFWRVRRIKELESQQGCSRTTTAE